MSAITLHQARTLIPRQAARLLDVPEAVVESRPWQGDDELPPLRLAGDNQLPAAGRVFKPDLVLSTAWLKMVVAWRASGSTAGILLAVRQLTRHWPTRTIPLLVVPFMGDTGRALCAEQGVSWLDLSGNADITAPGLRVKVEGQPNRHRRRGRPSGVFAPKAVRVTRLLLMHPEQAFAQKDMAVQTGLDAGFVSRIVRQLEEMGLAQRRGRQVVCAGADDLLQAWLGEEDFARHRILRGRAGALAGLDGDFHLAFHKLAGLLRESEVEHLATGLGAAHLLTDYQPFSQAAFYLREEPPARLLRRLGFVAVEAGQGARAAEASVQLVVPRDEGVFAGGVLAEGVPCAHPLQVVVDLHGMEGWPGMAEAAREAASRVRNMHLGW